MAWIHCESRIPVFVTDVDGRIVMGTGSDDCPVLTPAEARAVAAKLVRTADRIDPPPITRHPPPASDPCTTTT